jgi:hypothetical protein
MTPKEELDGFIDKFSPEVGALARKVLVKMRKRLPGAVELVYDNYNALAIGFGPTEHASEVIFSIALYPRWVSLFFFVGVDLPDPQKLLRGTGNRARHIVLEDPAALDKPAIRALMTHALKRAAKPLDGKSPNRIVIKSISAKQRPRQPANKS